MHGSMYYLTANSHWLSGLLIVFDDLIVPKGVTQRPVVMFPGNSSTKRSPGNTEHKALFYSDCVQSADTFQTQLEASRRPPGLPSQAPHCILSVSCSQARCPSPQLLIKSLSSTPGALWVCINPHSILVNTSFSLIGWRRLNSPRLDLCGAGPFGRRGITRHVQAVSVKGYFRGKCLKCVKVRCEQRAVEVWYWTALVPGLWQQAGLVLAFQFVLTFGFILKFWWYALTVCPFWLSDTCSL